MDRTKLHSLHERASMLHDIVKQERDNYEIANYFDQLADRLDRMQLDAELQRLDEYVNKYSPDQPRVPKGSPAGGEFAGGNAGKAGKGKKAKGRKAKDSVPDKVRAWLGSTDAKKLLVKGGIAAASTMAFHVPEHMAVHQVVDYLIHSLHAEGAIVASAITVAVKHAAHSLGISADHAKHWLAHTFRDVAKQLRSGSPRQLKGGYDLKAAWPYGPRAARA